MDTQLLKRFLVSRSRSLGIGTSVSWDIFLFYISGNCMRTNNSNSKQTDILLSKFITIHIYQRNWESEKYKKKKYKNLVSFYLTFPEM